MRFVIGRIIKHVPFLNKIWLSLLEYFDFRYYKTHCSNYKIVPFGNYCLPRVITTINKIKPTKRYGEETFPFDLCFSEFSNNVKLLSENFEHFYNNVEYDDNRKYWVSTNLNILFNHDNISIEAFKQRYDKRIENLYKILPNQQIHLYFIVATFKEILDTDIENFFAQICRYREKNTFDLIIINQSNTKFENNNAHIIDLTDDKLFKEIDKTGEWVGNLKKMRSIKARNFNKRLRASLLEIIEHNSDIS